MEELERAIVYFFEAGRKLVLFPVETVTIIWDMADFKCMHLLSLCSQEHGYKSAEVFFKTVFKILSRVSWPLVGSQLQCNVLGRLQDYVPVDSSQHKAKDPYELLKLTPKVSSTTSKSSMSTLMQRIC